MNGKKARILRSHFGPKTAGYRKAKRAYDTYPTAFAQRPKLAKERTPKRGEPAKPTWPGTEDQHQQSRPVIVVRRYWPGQNHKTGRIAA